MITFVDDQLRRRTIAVPFERSAGDDLEEMIEHVAGEVPLRSSTPYDNGG